MGSDTRTGSIPVCGTIKSSDSYESELFFHSPPKILRRSALADPAPSPVPTTSLAAARPVVLRDAQGSIGKAGWKNQKKRKPFERLKSGAQHQISRHSELGKHQAFLANNAGVCRKTSIFSTFFPRFSTAALRITQDHRVCGGEASPKSVTPRIYAVPLQITPANQSPV